MVEFKHIFEHFTANMTGAERRKKEDSKLLDGDGAQESKDAFTKATESLTNGEKKEEK